MRENKFSEAEMSTDFVDDLRFLAGDGPIVKVAIPRAARLLEWTQSRVKRLLYGESQPKAAERFQVREIARRRRQRMIEAENAISEVLTRVAAIEAELAGLAEALGGDDSPVAGALLRHLRGEVHAIGKSPDATRHARHGERTEPVALPPCGQG